MNIDLKTLSHLKDIFEAHNELSIEDIQNLNIHRDAIVRYLTAYRLALCVEKIHDIGNDRELSAQINLITAMISEMKTGIDTLHKTALKKMVEKQSQ